MAESESRLPDSVERVVSSLRDDILRRRYRAGDRLPSERELAEKLAVNRGAVREAFRVLSQLGLVTSGPGGARAGSLEDASVDVLAHLLVLEDRPDPHLVDQVLEAHGVLAAGWVRVLIDRGGDDEIDACRAVLHRLADPLASGSDHAKQIEELVQIVGDSTNLVLRLIRRGLQVHFSDRLLALGLGVHPPREMIVEVARQLDTALAERDGARGSELTYTMMKLHRERIVEALLAAEGAKSPATPASEATEDPAPVGVVREPSR
jgi:GntR family transcriptional repressor for pyruvate dehydrogenase complex